MNDIRKSMISIRDAMSITEVEQFGASIAERVLEYVEDHPNLRHILCFYPKGNEVNLLYAYRKLIGMYRLYFPVTYDNEIRFYRVNEISDNAFETGRFGIMEPKDRNDSYDILGSDEARATLCIAPGLVFSPDMGRIGYGGGYYDRFLSDHPHIIKCGVCYDFQIADDLEQKNTDIAMNMVVTDQRIYERDS